MLINSLLQLVVQEIAHYRRILDERSELRQLQSDLQSTKEAAEATRQYHLTSVSHLEEKLKVSCQINSCLIPMAITFCFTYWHYHGHELRLCACH